jgi:hypothetical protein
VIIAMQQIPDVFLFPQNNLCAMCCMWLIRMPDGIDTETAGWSDVAPWKNAHAKFFMEGKRDHAIYGNGRRFMPFVAKIENIYMHVIDACLDRITILWSFHV